MKKYAQPDTIKTGVIGYGPGSNMGKLHLEHMRCAGLSPICVVEPDPERRKTAGTEFPEIELYESVEKMLANSDVNLLAVITPHNTHYAIARQCLQAGKHVICEKPMTLTTEECDDLIEEAGQHGLLVTAYHNRHWNGDILQAVQKVKHDHAIGDIVRIELHPRVCYSVNDSWRCNRKLSGGIAYDWGVHLLEAALQLVDGDLLEVSGYAHNGFRSTQTKWGKDVVEDDFQLTARFGNGVWVMLTASNIDCLPKRNERGLMEITGTQGTFVSDPTGWKIFKLVKDKIVSENGPNLPDRWQCFYDEIRGFMVEGKPLTITPEWARRPVHILDLALRSIEAGRTLPAKYK